MALKINDLLIKGYEILKQEGIETYMLDTQLLLCNVLKVDKLYIIMNRDKFISKDLCDDFLKLINLRKEKMPIKYILGNCEFMGIDFYLEEGVLIPRPETEILVERAKDIIEKFKFKKICDLCCGSGIIGLSLAKLINNINVNLYDISDIAIKVSNKNKELLNLQDKVNIIKSDLLEKAINNKQKFDVIISNPPYIKNEVVETLMEDVKNYEPHLALCGGEDGLDFYKKIIQDSKLVLEKGGYLLFEIGYDQKESVGNLMLSNGFCDIICLKDYAGLDRVVYGCYK